MFLFKLYEKLSILDQEIAPGSESKLWQDFVQDTWAVYKLEPWSEKAHEFKTDKIFYDFWINEFEGVQF